VLEAWTESQRSSLLTAGAEATVESPLTGTTDFREDVRAVILPVKASPDACDSSGAVTIDT
jgi:hypothetical protein